MTRPKPKAPPYQSTTKYIRVADAKEMRRLVAALMFKAPWYMVVRQPIVKNLIVWEVQFPASVDMELLAASFTFEETDK
jgi:hypothetical protein